MVKTSRVVAAASVAIVLIGSLRRPTRHRRFKRVEMSPTPMPFLVSHRPNDPHYSEPDVSGHGQWNKGTCTANTAHVVNCLFEYYTDNSWRRKACSEKKQLKPKTVSNNRTTARRACDSTGQSISWRNHVNVDVDGQIDNSDVPYHQANVWCVVTGDDV
jgi:hypothetical protein